MNVFEYSEFRQAANPEESEIMAWWADKTEPPLVSILCTTFNQKRYLEDALRGFLMQRTDFPFEIIIHDDASTDGTIELLHDYADRYPRLIRLIIQSENKYTKGHQILPIAAEPARGDYFAICEADDFWIDPNKLQRQIAAMRRHPQYRISFHSCFMGCTDGGAEQFMHTRKTSLVYPKKSCVYDNRLLIRAGGGVIPTASIVVSKECIYDLPEWFHACPVGDYFLETLSTEPGGALFLPGAWSFYRLASVGSWTQSLKDEENKILHWWRSCRSLAALNAHLNEKYQKEITLCASEQTMRLLAESSVFRNKSVEFLNVANNMGNLRVKLGMRLLRQHEGAAQAYAQLALQTLRAQRLLNLWKNARLAELGLTGRICAA
jgi:glycosyltransferase involved in cell wall biosynthesis